MPSVMFYALKKTEDRNVVTVYSALVPTLNILELRFGSETHYTAE